MGRGLSYTCADAGLGAAVARVVADLVPGQDVVLAWQGTEAYLVVGGERRASAWASGDRREAAAYIGTVFRDVLSPAHPPCPEHAHPAALRATPDGVGWHCPEGGAAFRAYPF